MRLRAWLLAGLLALLAAPAPAAARVHRHHAASQVRPRPFGSCARLVAYARRHFAVTRGSAEPAVAPVAESPAPPSPTSTAAPTQSTAGAGTGFSTTNNQEEGVDEPDIVKTDGSTIFALANGKLRAVSVAGGTPRLVGSLDLGAGGSGAQLLLRGTRLIVVSGGGPVPLASGAPGPVRAAIAPGPSFGAETVVTEIDVRDPAAMRVTRTLTIDGSFVDARQNGGTARLVISSTPRAIAAPAARGAAAGWVPRLRFRSSITRRHHVRPIAACGAIRRPVDFSGLGTLTILTIDLDRGLWAVDSDALMADAQVVYGSQNGLYVATQKWIDPATAVARLPTSETTVIDRFDATDPDHTRFRSSGEVPGYLLNQFSLSESSGFLRAATTSRPIWWGGAPAPTKSQSYVTVLADRGGSLAPVGQVAGLGPGQQIYSVRFLGDVGYVVTFRQIDPLYTLDLSTPTAPRVAGQLELQGYSSYLHPVGAGLLLGIGQAVEPAGQEPSGTQLELFDVRDPRAPRLVQRTTLGNGSSSEVQYDHHAFLFWPPTKLAVLPLMIYARSQGPPSRSSQADQPFVGALGYRIDESGIAEVGRIVHDDTGAGAPAIRRSVVIGDRLFTVSDAGVMASSLATLAREAFAAFPNG